MSKKILKTTFATFTTMATCLVLATSNTAFAVDGKTVYESKGCAGCHGADANSPIMPTYPKVAGQNKEYIEQQLKDIKSGDRSNGQSAAMKGVMAAVSDEDITVLSEYLSGL